MTGFVAPSRRKPKKRHGGRYKDPASLTLDEKLDRLNNTLETRRAQLQEQASYRVAWLRQLHEAQSTMYGLSEASIMTETVATYTDDVHESSDSTVNAGNRQDRLVHVLCLGIGKISESRESQFQFIQLQDIATFFETSDVWVYDPMLDPVDIALLESTGFKIAEKNHLGNHELPLDRPALAYLPHCPRGLYEAFLRVNWNSGRFGWRAEHKSTSPDTESVGRHVMIANDFGDYSLSLPLDRLRAESPCLATIAPMLAKCDLPHLPTNHAAFTAFSSLVWQHLPATQAARLEHIPQLDSDPSSGVLPSGEVLTGEIGESRLT